MAQFGFGRQAAEPTIKPIKPVPLFRHALTPKTLRLPAEPHIDRFIASDDRLKHQPPQFSHPIWKAGRDIDGKGHPMALQDRIGPLQRVSIAVVDRDADKTTSKVALDQTAVHFVKTDEIKFA